MRIRNNNRRNFIKKAALGSLMAVSIPEILSAAMVPSSVKKNSLNKDNVILFQGDSITDSGRNRDDNSYNNARVLGSGYPMLAGAQLMAQEWLFHPCKRSDS